MAAAIRICQMKRAAECIIHALAHARYISLDNSIDGRGQKVSSRKSGVACDKLLVERGVKFFCCYAA